MHVPGFFPPPLAPPQVPGKGIVLQGIPLFQGQPRQVGLQVAEQLLIGIVLRRRGQGPGHQGQHRLLEHVVHGAAKHRDAVLLKHPADELPIAVHTPGAHRDVSAAQSLLPEQAQDLRCRPLHLLPGVGGRRARHPACLPPGLGQVAEQVPLQKGQRGVDPPGPVQPLLPGGDPLLPGPAQQPGSRPPPGAEQVRDVLPQISHKRHRHIPFGCQGQQDGLLLSGEVGEAEHAAGRLVGPIRLPQLLGQPVQPVPWVRRGLGGQSLIGGVDQPDVPPLVPLLASGLLSRLDELFRADLAGAALVHRGQKAGEKGRLPGGCAVNPEGVCRPPQGGVHQQHPPPRVQHGGGPTPRRIGEASGQPGEGEHLAPLGGPVAQRPAQGPLALVGVVLRHQKQPPGRAAATQPLQQLAPSVLPCPGIQDGQHGFFPLSWFFPIIPDLPPPDNWQWRLPWPEKGTASLRAAASSISLASADGESSTIPLRLLFPRNPLAPGFRGDPKDFHRTLRRNRICPCWCSLEHRDRKPAPPGGGTGKTVKKPRRVRAPAGRPAGGPKDQHARAK